MNSSQPSPGEFILSIGNLGIAIDVDDPFQTQSLVQKYRDFIQPVPLHLTLRIEILDRFKVDPTSSGLSYQDETLRLWSAHLNGEIDYRTGLGKIALLANTSDNNLDYALRYITAILAIRNGAFLFHGAGIRFQGAGWCFFGPSGSGKTTAARVSKGVSVLNDDLVLLAQAQQRWMISGTPFTHPGQLQPEQATAPLLALFRLVQDDTVYLEPVGRGRQIAEVLANLPILAAKSVLLPEAISLVEQLCQSVQIYRLHFLPDDSFWEEILRLHF